MQFQWVYSTMLIILIRTKNLRRLQWMHRTSGCCWTNGQWPGACAAAAPDILVKNFESVLHVQQHQQIDHQDNISASTNEAAGDQEEEQLPTSPPSNSKPLSSPPSSSKPLSSPHSSSKPLSSPHSSKPVVCPMQLTTEKNEMESKPDDDEPDEEMEEEAL